MSPVVCSSTVSGDFVGVLWWRGGEDGGPVDGRIHDREENILVTGSKYLSHEVISSYSNS